jgi:hypothetical protein
LGELVEKENDKIKVKIGGLSEEMNTILEAFIN